MLKRRLPVLIFCVGLSAAASAKVATTSAECHAEVKSIYTLLAGKTLPAPASKAAEDLLDQMSNQCTAQDFAAADQSAAALRAMAPGG